MKKTLLTAIAIVLATAAGWAISHSGGTDKYGCHKDHKNGDYHCHNPKG
jgi:hypothetical protein